MNPLIAHYYCLVLPLKWKYHIKQFQNNDSFIHEVLCNSVKIINLLETKQETAQVEGSNCGFYLSCLDENTGFDLQFIIFDYHIWIMNSNNFCEA